MRGVFSAWMKGSIGKELENKPHSYCLQMLVFISAGFSFQEIGRQVVTKNRFSSIRNPSALLLLEGRHARFSKLGMVFA
jgi:hypothetical protein